MESIPTSLLQSKNKQDTLSDILHTWMTRWDLKKSVAVIRLRESRCPPDIRIDIGSSPNAKIKRIPFRISFIFGGRGGT